MYATVVWYGEVATPGATRPEVAKLIVRIGFGGPDIGRPMRASKLAKTTSDFSTDVANSSGKLGKIAAHQCAQLHWPLAPMVARSSEEMLARRTLRAGLANPITL